MLHIKLKGITNAATWSQLFGLQTYPLILKVRTKGKKKSYHGHVAYQIKGNHECSNMVSNILPADLASTPQPPPPALRPWGRANRSKLNFFRTWSRSVSFAKRKCKRGISSEAKMNPKSFWKFVKRK